jgi:hypothetical protein
MAPTACISFLNIAPSACPCFPPFDLDLDTYLLTDAS